MPKYHGDISAFGNSVRSTSDKSYVVATILLLFLGFLGIHRFYLGQINWGIAHLIMFSGGAMFDYLVFGVQAIILFVELVFFIYEAVRQVTD